MLVAVVPEETSADDDASALDSTVEDGTETADASEDVPAVLQADRRRAPISRIPQTRLFIKIQQSFPLFKFFGNPGMRKKLHTASFFMNCKQPSQKALSKIQQNLTNQLHYIIRIFRSQYFSNAYIIFVNIHNMKSEKFRI